MECDDPSKWSVEQVCRFFKDDAQRLLDGIPHSPPLPALLPFLQALRDNDVSGFVLLTSVTTGDLRDDFGIKSFGQRSSILHCINILRERSSACTKKSGQKPDPEQITLAATPHAPSASETLAAERPIPAPTRFGEVQVYDEHGRKRRKLNLSAVATAVPTVSPGSSEDIYFGNASMPVDSIFFGKTELGREIVHPESTEFIVLDTDRANDSSEHNFQFHALQKPAGETQYVYRQTHRYFQQEPIYLMRRGRQALATLPYREELSQLTNKVRSAMVVQHAGESDLLLAIRENVAYLDNGGDYNGITQGSALGQFDYLTEKYGVGDQNDSDTESISSAAFDQMQAEIDAEWAEERAELEASQDKMLTAANVEKIVDKTVEGFIHHWTTIKRPGKDANQAWSIWKMMKRSKNRRTGLIEDAKAKIDAYSRRLDGQKLHVVKAECCKEEEVVRLCEALRSTVIDREEQKWRIDVWQRKQEPDHIVRHGQHTGSKAATSAGHTNPAFVPRPEDRFSVEPNPAQALEHQEDVFLTPKGSPTIHLEEAEDEGFDGSDEASKLDDFVEDDNELLGDSPLDKPTNLSPEEDQASPSMPHAAHGNHGRRARSLSVSSSDADRLPGMESFFTQTLKKTPKRKHQFSKPSEPASASRPKPSVVIDISSDSNCTPNSSSTRGEPGRTKVEFSRDLSTKSAPENSSVYAVDSWNIEELVKTQDRKRLIIKLIRLEGALGIFRIKALWIKRSMVGLKEDVTNLLRKIRDDPQASHAPGPLLQSARLAMVWSCVEPDIMQGIYPQKVDWVAVERDLRIFMSFFAVLMQKSDSRLFVEHEQSPSPSPWRLPNRKPTPQEPIEIDSDSPIETPHSTRKRRVKYSQKAVESQHIAMERHVLYKAAETQSSNSQNLFAKVGQHSVQLPIDLTKQAEGAHFIHPAIAPSMKEHQINGVRFMWRELTAGAGAGEDGQGCVLAHAMGLGKSMQTITLLVAVTMAAQSKDLRVSSQLPRNLRPVDVAQKERYLRVLVLCPPSLLENWRREIDQWSHGGIGSVYIVDAASKNSQMDTLRTWHVFGGVLIMGYSLFNKRVNRTKAEEKAGESHRNGAQLDEYLLEGPEILIADEAHNVKNIRAGISLAVNNIQTRSRIALTGTPMSNDVGEMYALISFVAPGFLGGPLEFKAKFGEPIEQGTWADSTPYEQRRSKMKLSTLSRLIEPKIHRADITALKGTLQPKLEFVVTLPLTDLQRSVYNRYIDALLGEGKNEEASQVTLFSWLAILSLLTNHPLAFKRKLNEAKKPRKAIPDNLGKAVGVSASPIAVDDEDGAEAGPDYEEIGLKTLGFSEATVQHITGDIEDSTDPSLSAKMDVLTHILALSRRCGDKVLVFSSSIPTLNYVGDLLRAQGTKFGRICGSVPARKRLAIISEFTNGSTEILIISTKAGGVGLNIQAANRVVILDFGFNPAHEEQAIGRAYRFGQPKPVFVYRLIAGGTFEDNIYNKQLFKTSLTQRVVDKKNPRRNAARTRQYLYPPNDVPQQNLEEWVGKDPQVFDELLRRQLIAPQGTIRKLTTIETLQREGDDLPLNAEELRQAEEEYQMSIAAAMGPRSQVANLDGVPTFAESQARAGSTQQQATHRKLMVKFPMLSSESPSTAPSDRARRKTTIHMASSVTPQRKPIPHGLPSTPSSQQG